MVVFKVVGGLGNQLYIYNFAKRVQKEFGYNVALDISWYRNNPKDVDNKEPRGLELLKFDIDLPLVYFTHWKTICFLPFGDKIRYIVNKILAKLKLGRFTLKTKHIFIAPAILYDSDMIDIPDNSYVSGYFANYRYFGDTMAEIRLKEKMDFANLEMKKKIDECENSVCVHIRRGDYMSIHAYAKLGATYYKKAIETIEEMLNQRNIKWQMLNFNNGGGGITK